MQTQTLKQAAHELVDELPEDASWQDLVYRIVLRASVERGLSEADAGLLTPQDEVEKEFGLGS
jgi:predicted transcriptional regulator